MAIGGLLGMYLPSAVADQAVKVPVTVLSVQARTSTPAATPAAHVLAAATTIKPLAAAAISPPFHECPAIGADTSCGVLIDVTSSGELVYSDPTEGPYDGADDTLTGAINNSGRTVTSLQLASNNNIFGFDGDGICSGGYVGTPLGCPFGPTGYEGPGTSFSGINAAATGGIVTFKPALPPGATAYFSLEEALQAAVVFSGGPTVSEQGGSPNTTEASTTCSTGSPVNCATGTFWHTFTDAHLPGLGLPLDFARTYVSANASANGPLGYGWTDSYNVSLGFDVSGNATITQEDGSTVSFRAFAGGYVGAPWVRASFVANGDGTYTFTRYSTNVQYVFNASGQLIKEIARDGQTTTLTYNSSGELTSVAAPSGRALTLGYSGSHVVSLTDPLGNKTTYGYDSAGDLTTATDPLGRTWTFTYDANHLLLSMTDPRGGVTTNTYNSSAQVIKQVDPAGRETQWSYWAKPPPRPAGRPRSPTHAATRPKRYMPTSSCSRSRRVPARRLRRPRRSNMTPQRSGRQA